MKDSITDSSHPQHCLFCGSHDHEHTGHTDDNLALCPSCKAFFGERLLKALSKVPNLPDIIGGQPATRKSFHLLH